MVKDETGRALIACEQLELWEPHNTTAAIVVGQGDRVEVVGTTRWVVGGEDPGAGYRCSSGHVAFDREEPIHIVLIARGYSDDALLHKGQDLEERLRVLRELRRVTALRLGGEDRDTWKPVVKFIVLGLVTASWMVSVVVPIHLVRLIGFGLALLVAWAVAGVKLGVAWSKLSEVSQRSAFTAELAARDAEIDRLTRFQAEDRASDDIQGAVQVSAPV